MSKTLIIFAQHAEAKAFLEESRAEPILGHKTLVWSEGEQAALYAFEKGFVAISGVGLHQAQMAVAKYGPQCAEIWNLGLAGALKEGLEIGKIQEIETIGKHVPVDDLDPKSKECLSFILPHLALKKGGGKLISSDFPIHNTSEREKIGKTWDLVDMEGYGIAFAAAALNIKCRMWKIVSDFASPGGRELIRKHKNALSVQMAQTIFEHLN